MAEQGCSASSRGTNLIEDHGSTQEIPAFLSFTGVVRQFQIPIVNKGIADPQRRADAAVGILGKGGQYVVDRTYSNQRYPGRKGLVAESNTVYKRIIWSTQHQTSDSIHQDSQLQAFANEVRALGRLRRSPYIIKLIEIAWERDTYAQLTPVLGLEYAQHNSLARFLSDVNGNNLTFRESEKLINNVTGGIHHLHSADFIWGDCKPENVLICQDSSDPTAFVAKISDFGLSLWGSSKSARFRGFSVPWTSREAKEAVGMPALKQSEMYSLGLVIWSILMHGQQFQSETWGSDESLEIEDNGDVSDRHVLALTESGELQDIAITSFSSMMISTIAEFEIQFFSEVLRLCLASHASDRPSAKALHEMVRSKSDNFSTSEDNHGDNDHEFDMEWLTENFGPSTRLHDVGIEIVRQLEMLAHKEPSQETEFQLSVCYATGFGCEQNLHTAVQHMRTSALLGNEKAHNLHVELAECAKTFTARSAVTNPALSAPLIDLWDDFEDNNDLTTLNSASLPEAHSSQDEDLERKQSSPKGKEKAIGQFPLHAAAIRSDLDELRSLLSSSRCDVNEKNEDQESALFCAVQNGQHKAVQVLLGAGADFASTDTQNRTILHGLVTLFGQPLEQMITTLTNAESVNEAHLANLSKVVRRRRDTGTADPKTDTPLEVAVDLRNIDAVRYLIKIGMDPASNSRSSALHRAASRHDCEVLALLLKNVSTEALMRFDHNGRSTLACAISNINIFDRLLLSNGDVDASEKIMKMIPGKGHSLHRLDIVTEIGENAVYYALKSGYFKQHMLNAFWGWNFTDKTLNMLPAPTGPNRWSALRRALYCNHTAPFEQICTELGKDAFRDMLNEVSPDGLSILHELAFLPTSNARSLFTIISETAAKHSIRIPQKRAKSHSSRPRMTPFQLAVLCGNLDLADYYIMFEAGPKARPKNPLSGLEGSRFLAFIIDYPLRDPQELSTWLSLILDDPMVENMRRFPHPTSTEQSLRYLLEHEEGWWATRRNIRSANRRLEGPRFDKDAEHDPFLSWTPNLATVYQAAIERREHAAADRLGAGGWLDNNTFGWGHRKRHTLDYRSFLLRHDTNGQAYNIKGHPYMTALELGLSVALNSEYKTHAAKAFATLLEHFHGPKYCNFPYYQYLPGTRLCLQHLRRRETILHQAIRHKNAHLVHLIITAGADIQMANIQWHTPLHLAMLLDNNKDPYSLGHQGTFLARVGLASSPAVQTEATADTPPSRQIRSLLEREIMNLSSWSQLLRFRALREVKWPWDEYETDDLGVRFLLFNLGILAIVMGILMLISRLLSFFPYLMYTFGMALSEGFDVVIELQRCYMGCMQNGSDPHEVCVAHRYDIAPVDLGMVVPALEHHLQSIIEVLDDCYDNSTNATGGALRGRANGEPDLWDEDEEEEIVPGCGGEDVNTTKYDRSALQLDYAVYRFLKKECKCGCTWFNEPHMKAPLPGR